MYQNPAKTSPSFAANPPSTVSAALQDVEAKWPPKNPLPSDGRLTPSKQEKKDHSTMAPNMANQMPTAADSKEKIGNKSSAAAQQIS
ncbi:hypothetical protein Nepgr_014828 [Nepenthes gracilis]|uniref:Uncharacterized protein n=1 Tax=Nepenthes gracilis TaxID=150966 RepID=A0AAD3XPV4_NEPGR|nr:hypothetical protein Nepgr_014828 [Nepenthes gracilis]